MDPTGMNASRERRAEIVRQVGDVGYFARIAATISERREDGVTVSFAPEIEARFAAGIRFGIEFAWERIARQSTKLGGGLVVEVTALEWAPIDTTFSVIAYLAARLIFDNFDRSNARAARFEPDRGGFFFPR